MRWLIVAVVVFGASWAGAQSIPEPVRFLPDYEERERDPQIRYYPDRAMRRGASGLSALCCTVRADRRLDCEIAVEWPQDLGFGDAGIGFTRQLRLTRESYERYTATPGAYIQLETTWSIPPVNPDVAAELQRLRYENRNVCAEPSAPAN